MLLGEKGKMEKDIAFIEEKILCKPTLCFYGGKMQVCECTFRGRTQIEPVTGVTSG